MQLTPSIMILLLGTTAITHAMDPTELPTGDIMQPAVKNLIEILNHPEKYEQPDHIFICGERGSGKNAIFTRIAKDIGASYVSCDASELIEYNNAFLDKSILRANIKKIVVDKVIGYAKQTDKKVAILLIKHFHLLYENRNSLPSLMRFLDSSLYQEEAIKNDVRFLICCKSRPLNSSISGENVILTSPCDKTLLEKMLGLFS